MGLCEKSKSTFDECTWKWCREQNQAIKHSSGYYPGGLPQPGKAGQHLDIGNAENITKVFLEKSNPKAHNSQIRRVETKEKNAKGSQRERLGYPQREAIRLTADLSAETLQARREWGPIFNILKKKNFQPRILHPVKLSFISEGEIKTFTNKQLLRDFIDTRPALQELLKDALNTERNIQYQPLQKRTKW